MACTLLLQHVSRRSLLTDGRPPKSGRVSVAACHLTGPRIRLAVCLESMRCAYTGIEKCWQGRADLCLVLE